MNGDLAKAPNQAVVPDPPGSAPSRSTSEVRLFWWKQKPNFGDDLSRHVVAHLAGKPVAWDAPATAELFAIGSLADKILKTHDTARPGKRPILWGTGMLGPVDPILAEIADVRALRGPLSATILGVRGIALGDPGLFSADLDLPWPERDGRIGLILHITQALDRRLERKLKRAGGFKLINAAQPAPEVLRDIASCRHVYSSSLHGLVVSDALGIANTWLSGPDIHRTPEFKFYDYGLAIGRAFPPPIDVSGIVEHAARLPRKTSAALPYARGIDTAKAGLRAAFPEEFRSVQHEGTAE